MLELRGLSVAYGPIEAVKRVDLSVADGEAVALIGPNGAGKTSTLRAISNLERSDGEIHFDGIDVRSVPPQKRARLGLIHVQEGRQVFAPLTVHENLQLGLTARRGRDGYTIEQVYELFPALGRIRKRDGWMLSGGEQQMVAIGRALVAAPRLLLLDEPSLGLAPTVTKAVFAALREIARTTAVLVVEQNTAMALDLCSRGYVLSGGRVVLSGSASELQDRQALLDSYLGQREAHTESSPAGAAAAVAHDRTEG